MRGGRTFHGVCAVGIVGRRSGFQRDSVLGGSLSGEGTSTGTEAEAR